MRIISYNTNGIRAAINKGLLDWLKTDPADIICIQETKAHVKDIDTAAFEALGFHAYWFSAEKKGYSGVGIYSKQKPDAVIEGLANAHLADMPHEGADIDAEGRYLECRFGHLCVISLYLPSGSSGEERQQFKFSVMARFMLHLEKLISQGYEVLSLS